MIDASLELQGAIVARLKATAVLTAIVGQRIYDDVPVDAHGNVTATFPYVAFGPEQVLPDEYECIPGSEIFVRIDAWSRAAGFPEVKKIAGAIRKALHNYDLPLLENALVSFEFYRRQIERAPDGKTSQAIVTFRAVVEHD